MRSISECFLRKQVTLMFCRYICGYCGVDMNDERCVHTTYVDDIIHRLCHYTSRKYQVYTHINI